MKEKKNFSLQKYVGRKLLFFSFIVFACHSFQARPPPTHYLLLPFLLVISFRLSLLLSLPRKGSFPIVANCQGGSLLCRAASLFCEDAPSLSFFHDSLGFAIVSQSIKGSIFEWQRARNKTDDGALSLDHCKPSRPFALLSCETVPELVKKG